MAVEAAWQVFTEQHSGDRIMGYTLRNVSIQTAMRIPEDDRGLEVTFSLEQHNLPNGVFYRFRISSVTHSDDVWTDHCSGEIRPLTNSATMCEFQAHEKITGPLDPRMLSSEQWYSTFSDIGISYGPSFQAVSDLTSDPMTNTVEAKVALKTTKNHFNGAESSYLLHPASLDACHQLAIVSGHQGHCENAHHAFVPTFFKQVSLWVPKNPSQDSAIAVCCSARRGIRGLYAQIQLVDQAGDPLLSIEDLRCVAYGERNDGERITRRPYRNLAWKPDSLHISQDYVNRAFPPTAVQHDFVTSMNNLSRLCAYIIAEIAMEPKFQLIEHQLKPHMKKFLFWIRRSLRTDDHVLREAASMSSNDRRDVISTLSAQLGAKVEAKLITRIFNNLDDIFSGHKSGLEIALQDGLLSQLYASSVGIAGAYPQLGRLVDLCVFRNSHMNILEIGAGTGGATRVVLETLRPSSPERLFKQYTFTDVSTAFLASARSQFDFGESMVFGTLDFEDDPLGQGYEQRYDLIIASECLHTSRNIEKALRNIRGLLKPQGQLLVVETTRALSAHGLLLGTFPDYWVGTDDCRPDNPFLDEEGWDAVLRRAGFSGIDIRLNDYPCPYNIASVFLSTCLANSVPAPIEQTSPVCLVNRAEGVNICDLVASKCEQLRVPFTQEAKLSSDSGRAICFLRCQDVNDFQSQELFNLVKQVVQHCRSALWVTLPDISNGGNTTAAIMMGLLRVVSAENPQARHAIVDLQGSRLSMIDTNLATQLIRLEEGLQDWQNSKSFEREYIWKNNCLHISRLVPDRSRNANFHPLHSKQRAIEEVPLRGQSPFKVAYEKPGILSSIFFRADPLFVQALPDDYMIVRTEAVGLNWKDAAVALGRFDLNNSSSEFAGVVTQLGSQVRDFSIGDRVYGFAFGNFGNYMRLPACLARRMPEKASFVSMATTPVVFASALYALKRVARLQAHDTVLIQSATGGLGIAAIQVAKLIGATVFATAGSERKRTYLREKHRIPASRIYDSREIPDIKRLLHITGGRGFDVVLNTSSGLIMDATWSAIAAQGRFVDVGRVDVHQNGTISLEPFNRNASFASFDLGRLGVATISELMQEVDDLFQAGAVQPILPVTEFDVAQLGSAIAKLSEGKHLGKVVVNYENLDSTIPVSFSSN
jgi:NADPH:quinone reductase-like Zn-dependent oxidoreductase/SAM-dependent methyltransferase